MPGIDERGREALREIRLLRSERLLWRKEKPESDCSRESHVSAQKLHLAPVRIQRGTRMKLQPSPLLPRGVNVSDLAEVLNGEAGPVRSNRGPGRAVQRRQSESIDRRIAGSPSPRGTATREFEKTNNDQPRTGVVRLPLPTEPWRRGRE